MRAVSLKGNVHRFKKNAQKMINAGNPTLARKYCEEKRIPFPPYPEKYIPDDPPYFDPSRVGYTEPGEVESLITSAATSMLAKGKAIVPRATSRKPLSPQDRALISRALAMTPEVFCEHVNSHLRNLIDKTMQRVEEKLNAGEHKPADLSFLLAVLMDKHAKLEGRSQLANASINVQVNNYGDSGQSKEDMMRELGYDTPAPHPALPAGPTIPVTPIRPQHQGHRLSPIPAAFAPIPVTATPVTEETLV